MKKTASLVLSSGGARGLAHIGVIEGLLEQGYHIDSISGSSMGAVVGGVYATGRLPEFKEWVCNLDKMDVFKLIDFTLSTQGFIRGERVFNQMKKFIDDRNIEDLDIPFTAVATDIVNKREVVFNSGSLYKALRTSAAIPSVLKPSIIDGAELVDGGVINPIPIAYIKPGKGSIIVVSDVNAAVPSSMKLAPVNDDKGRFAPLMEKWNTFFPKTVTSKTKRMSYFELVAKSVDLMQDKISEYIIEHSRPDIVVRISRDTCGTFEFYRSKDIIEFGKQEFNKALKDALQRAE